MLQNVVCVMNFFERAGFFSSTSWKIKYPSFARKMIWTQPSIFRSPCQSSSGVFRWRLQLSEDVSYRIVNPISLTNHGTVFKKIRNLRCSKCLSWAVLRAGTGISIMKLCKQALYTIETARRGENCEKFWWRWAWKRCNRFFWMMGWWWHTAEVKLLRVYLLLFV